MPMLPQPQWSMPKVRLTVKVISDYAQHIECIDDVLRRICSTLIFPLAREPPRSGPRESTMLVRSCFMLRFGASTMAGAVDKLVVVFARIMIMHLT